MTTYFPPESESARVRREHAQHMARERQSPRGESLTITLGGKPRLCVDCGFYRSHVGTVRLPHEPRFPGHECTHPYTRTVDLVTGGEALTSPTANDCEAQRHEWLQPRTTPQCGPRGKWFAPKEASE